MCSFFFKKWKSLSVSDCLWPRGLCSPWNSPGQNSCSLLQGIFPTQESNPGLPHCRWVLYQLSHRASPRILEWVAYPFSSGSSQPGNWTGVSCIAGGFFTNWTIREARWNSQNPELILKRHYRMKKNDHSLKRRKCPLSSNPNHWILSKSC